VSAGDSDGGSVPNRPAIIRIGARPAMLPFKGRPRSEPVWVLDHTEVQWERRPTMVYTAPQRNRL
jgi:hypothetical protein